MWGDPQSPVSQAFPAEEQAATRSHLLALDCGASLTALPALCSLLAPEARLADRSPPSGSCGRASRTAAGAPVPSGLETPHGLCFTFLKFTVCS